MMKRFLSKIFIVGIVVIGVLLSVELFVRSIPNEYSYKKNYLESNIECIQVLAVGSSIGRSGIDPSCFRDNTFNVANVSQDIETDCAIIDKYLSRANNLHTVIFTILPGSYCGRMGEGIERWRLRKYHIYMDLNVERPPLSERLEISNMSSVYEQISKRLKGRPTIECDEKGMGNDSNVASEEAKISQAERISVIHNSMYKPSNYYIVMPRLEHTLKQCSNRGIKVLLCLLPVHRAYSERIDNKMLTECDSISKKLSSKYPNVVYYNMFNDSTFVTEDFRNSNHLSRQGAKKLSTRLDITINEDLK